MIDYAHLEERSHTEDWEIKYKRFTVWTDDESPALRMTHKGFPVGLKEAEGTVLLGAVNDLGLKRGFEVATGFGLSATWAGLAFRKNGGKLVTLDAYIEEHDGDPNSYRPSGPRTYEGADGYRSVLQLREKFELQRVVYPVVGWSPDAVGDAITEVHGGEPLDYAFIDGGHWDEAVIRDVNAIAPFLDKERFVVFFHDLHCLNASIEHAQRVLGGGMQVLVAPPNGWNLGCIARGI